mmetsp:Transcript_36479/g.108309  ORF Transcript_36479/g.108309 Transcript_36479/m.108309 type:complete len:263 (+) Transcript_36479:744-1532(+)
MSPARSLARRSYTCAVGSPLTSLRVASLRTITTTSSIVLLLSSSRRSAAHSSMDCSRRRCLFCDGAGELRVAMRLVGTQAPRAERPPPAASLADAACTSASLAAACASASTSSAAVAIIWTSRPAVREVSAVDAAASASSNGRSPLATSSLPAASSMSLATCCAAATVSAASISCSTFWTFADAWLRRSRRAAACAASGQRRHNRDWRSPTRDTPWAEPVRCSCHSSFSAESTSSSERSPSYGTSPFSTASRSSSAIRCAGR